MALQLRNFPVSSPPEREAPENHHWFRLVTPAKDSHGTVILPQKGQTRDFSNNPVFLWMHSHGPKKISPITPPPDVVIGKVVEIAQDDRALDILVHFDVEDTMGAQCYGKVKRGFIRAVSVGFDGEPVLREVTELEASLWPGCRVGEKLPVFEDWTLVEASLVIIPSNREALGMSPVQAMMRALEEDNHEFCTDCSTHEQVGQGEPPTDTPPEAAANIREAAVPVPVATVETFPPPAIQSRTEHENRSQTKMAAKHLRVGGAVYFHRMMIGHHLEGAMHHMRLMHSVHEQDGMEHPHHGMHREMAHANMASAERLASCLREAMQEPDGDQHLREDGEEMRAAKRTIARAFPTVQDAETNVRAQKCVEAIGNLDVVTVGEIASKLLDTTDPDKVDVRITSLQTTKTRYLSLVNEQRQAQEDTQSVERSKVLEQLLSDGLITPAIQQRATAERWSLVKLGELKNEVSGLGPVVPIVRASPLLRGPDASATPQAPTAPVVPVGGQVPQGSLGNDQPAPQTRSSGSNVPKEIRDLAALVGVDSNGVASIFDREAKRLRGE